jgi:hypothetical protein
MMTRGLPCDSAASVVWRTRAWDVIGRRLTWRAAGGFDRSNERGTVEGAAREARQGGR